MRWFSGGYTKTSVTLDIARLNNGEVIGPPGDMPVILKV